MRAQITAIKAYRIRQGNSRQKVTPKRQTFSQSSESLGLTHDTSLITTTIINAIRAHRVVTKSVQNGGSAQGSRLSRDQSVGFGEKRGFSESVDGFQLPQGHTHENVDLPVEKK